MRLNLRTPGMLLTAGVLSALVWRGELEFRWGWHDLRWIYSLHLSGVIIPVIFSVWLYRVAPCAREKVRGIRSVAAVIGGMSGYILYGICFVTLYARLPLPPGFRLCAIGILNLLIPLGVCLFARLFSGPIPFWMWWTVPVCFFLCFPLALFLLSITQHPGPVDVVHTVKSGFIFLGLVPAAGIAFLWSSDQTI